MVISLNHHNCYWAIINKLIAEKDHQVKTVDIGVYELFHETGHGRRITYAFVFQKSMFSVKEAERWLYRSRFKFEWTHESQVEIKTKIKSNE